MTTNTADAVLLCADFPDGFREEVAARWPLLELGPDLPAERVRAAVTYGTIGFDRALMDQLPSLGLIACYGSGYERVDLEAAASRSILVTSNVGANASCVADLAMALLLACARRLPQADRHVRSGAWSDQTEEGEDFLVPGLGGRKLGIVGLGAIGERVAKRAAAFEMEIGYHNRGRRDDVPWAYHESAEALAAWADILVVACRGNAANRNLIDGAVLDALGRDGILVNVSRGSVVDEAALTARLASGRLAAAGLDVFAEEPNVPPALRALDNIVLTPHLGGTTESAQAAMCRGMIRMLEEFFAGRRPPNVVDAPAGG